MRDRGIGAALLERLAADPSSDNGRGIVLEIEDPASSDDSHTAERRLRFYERWGAAPLTDLLGYYIPDRVEPQSEYAEFAPGGRLSRVLAAVTS